MTHIFPSSSPYGIPDIAAPSIEDVPEPPLCLIPYNIRVRSQLGYTDAAMHFFLDDYRFEYVWSNPNQAFERIGKAWLALTPDFSLYMEFPKVAQIWNTYRNRWCGAFWQSQGVAVIPTIAWSDESSYEFCFDGVEHCSPVAVSTVGLRGEEGAHERFARGFDEMVARINPRFIINYGKLPSSLKDKYNMPIKAYPTYWDSLKKARKLGKAEDFYAGDAAIHKGE